MPEFQNQIPLSGPPPVVTGGPGNRPGWLQRLRELIWPIQASKGRRIAVIAVVLGILLSAVLIWLFVLANRPAPPAGTPPPSAEETGQEPQTTDPKPPAAKPQPSQQPSAQPQNNGASQGGTGNSGTTGGGSTPSGGTSGGGSTGGGNNGGGNTGGGTASCPLPAYPKASCTGVPAGTSLIPYGSSYATTHDNQVIDGALITGDLEIDHSNIIIRNSEIHGHIKNFSGGNFIIQDSLVGPPTGCLSDAAIGNNRYTATRVHLRGFAEGFRVEDAGDVIVRDSYIKFCNPGVDNHADAIQGYLGGSNVIFEHNTVDMLSIPKEADYVTAVIFWSDSSGNNVIFKDNLISGGSYSIRIHVGTGHVVSGNKVINNSWLYGPVSSSCSNIAWSGNSIVEIDSNYNITSTVSQLDCAE